MILYKYRGDSEFTQQIFSTRKVWLSTAAQLNDPFEASLQEIAPDWIAQKVKAMKEAQLAGFIVAAAQRKNNKRDFFGLSSPELEQMLARFRRIKDFDEAYREFRAFMLSRRIAPSDPEKSFSQLEEQLQGVGIFSLSEDCENALMWAHYAGDHKGLCLGFEIVDGSPLADKERCLKVVYADSIPRMGDDFRHQITIKFNESGPPTSTGRIAFTDPAVQAAISTKAACWSYEREWRYVEPRSGAYPWPGRLAEVIFGLRCPAECRLRYSELVAEFVHSDVRVYEMQKIPNSNSLERVPLPPIAGKEGKVGGRAGVGNSVTSSIRQVATLLQAGQVSAVLEVIGPILEGSPKNADLWCMKGVALGSSGDHLGALECFDRAIDLNNEFFSAWYHKGVALTVLGRYPEAVAAYERASSLEQRDASTAFNLGTVLWELERWDEAIRELRRAERLGHPRAKYRLNNVPPCG